MEHRELHSITESRELLGGISRNSIYALLNAGKLPSVIVGRRRFIAACDCGVRQGIDNDEGTRPDMARRVSCGPIIAQQAVTLVGGQPHPPPAHQCETSLAPGARAP